MPTNGIEQQIDGLRALQTNWNGKGANAYDPVSLDTIQALLLQVRNWPAGTPTIDPVACGSGSVDVIAQVSPDLEVTLTLGGRDDEVLITRFTPGTSTIQHCMYAVPDTQHWWRNLIEDFLSGQTPDKENVYLLFENTYTIK